MNSLAKHTLHEHTINLFQVNPNTYIGILVVIGYIMTAYSAHPFLATRKCKLSRNIMEIT